ncbi:hypothetical protein LTR28_010185 [Elasticomyces elasticus]|nr:hypothetical protein LTR28_010185 [Elasticomyces elasticus]
MSGPEEMWKKLQRNLVNAQRTGSRFSGGGAGGSPRGAIGGIAGIALLGGTIWVFNNALFNGTHTFSTDRTGRDFKFGPGPRSNLGQNTDALDI